MGSKKNIYRFEFMHKYTTANEYIDACRTSWPNGNRLKQENVDTTTLESLKYRIVDINYPVKIVFVWHRTMRSDPDNIAFSKKFILDGMVAAGILEDDRYKQIVELRDQFVKCKKGEEKVVVYILDSYEMLIFGEEVQR